MNMHSPSQLPLHSDLRNSASTSTSTSNNNNSNIISTNGNGNYENKNKNMNKSTHHYLKLVVGALGIALSAMVFVLCVVMLVAAPISVDGVNSGTSTSTSSSTSTYADKLHEHVIQPALSFRRMLQDSSSSNEEDKCRPIRDIYADGKELCENMWSNSFKYVPVGHENYSQAYTMWHFEPEKGRNPNDETTRRRIEAGLHGKDIENENIDESTKEVTACHLDEHYHKDEPGPEPDTFTECHPWKEYACCHEETVSSLKKIRDLYGPEWRWDRCGKMTPECERFFVFEACFYECDVNVGLFRKFPKHIYDETNENHNQWQLEHMPIKGGFCDAFYDACMHDSFCAVDDGDFFSCAKEYSGESGDGLSSGAVAAIVIVAIASFGGVLFLVTMIRRERRGDPMFAPIDLDTENAKNNNQQTGDGTGGNAATADASPEGGVVPENSGEEEGADKNGTARGAISNI